MPWQQCMCRRRSCSLLTDACMQCTMLVPIKAMSFNFCWFQKGKRKKEKGMSFILCSRVQVQNLNGTGNHACMLSKSDMKHQITYAVIFQNSWMRVTILICKQDVTVIASRSQSARGWWGVLQKLYLISSNELLQMEAMKHS